MAADSSVKALRKAHCGIFYGEPPVLCEHSGKVIRLKLFQLGKDTSFFNLLGEQADTALQAAKTFHTLVKNYALLDDYVKQIDEIEHKGDELTHQLAQKVDSSFVTPMDKEDLHAISVALDDVTDAIKAIAQTLVIYKLPQLRSDIEPLALLLVQIMELTKEVVIGLQDFSSREVLRPSIRKINHLETQADDTYRNALSELFHSNVRDPFLFIAWKEVYDRVESAINHCEKIANLIEGMVVKYA